MKDNEFISICNKMIAKVIFIIQQYHNKYIMSNISILIMLVKSLGIISRNRSQFHMSILSLLTKLPYILKGILYL